MRKQLRKTSVFQNRRDIDPLIFFHIIFRSIKNHNFIAEREHMSFN